MKNLNLYILLSLISIGILSIPMEQPESSLPMENTLKLSELKKQIRRTLRNKDIERKIANSKHPLKKIKSILEKFNINSLPETEKKELFNFARNLLQEPFDINYLNKNLWQEIRLFSFAPTIDVVRGINHWLIIGADPNVKSDVGSISALMALVINAGTEKEVFLVMENLLDFGADINAQDDFGMTALMYAAKFNKKPIVEFLLRHGANKNIRNGFNQTASQIALAEKNSELAEFIEKFEQGKNK